MKFTNKFNLPTAFVKAVEAQAQKPHPTNLRATTLVYLSPRIAELEKRHWDELTMDVVEAVKRLTGSIAHGIIEKYGNGFEEKHLEAEFNGVNITGTVDVIEGGCITDWKTTSVWQYVFGAKADWNKQVNVYKWLAEKNGLNITKMEIVALYPDWVAPKTKHSDYPSKALEQYVMPVMEDVEKYLASRVPQFIEARALADVNLPMCTPEERYTKKSTWAIMKNDNHDATRVFPSEEEAKKYLYQIPPSKNNYKIVERTGEETRCLYYCPVWQFCDHGKKVHQERK